MRMSWVGVQLLLSCTLLLGLAVFGVGGKCCKRGEPSAEEGCCRKRHAHLEEECCRKRHAHLEEECCRKRHAHLEEECCRKRHAHLEEECCRKRHAHLKEECCERRHAHLEESEESEESEEAEKVEKLKEVEQEERAKELEESGEEKWEREMERMQQKEMAILAAQGSVPRYLKVKAMNHYNRLRSGPFYQHLEESQLKMKRAIGMMVYLKVVLAKTNCSKGEEREGGVEYSRGSLENKGCQPLPESEQEKQDCTFDIFIDTRSGKKTVIGYDCITLPRSEELLKTLEAH